MVTMATPVTRPESKTGTKPARGRGRSKDGSNGNGSRRNGGGGGGWDDRHGGFSPERYRIGMWVALAAILMMFAALTSAYVFRAGIGGWRAVELPRVLWLSTVLILASSVTLEVARRALRWEETERYRRWLSITLLLGGGFLASQIWAWRQLAAQGVYVATSPHSSFVYILTGLHGAHLLGGLLALIYLAVRAWSRAQLDEQRVAQRRAATDIVSLYWHFMDGLWLYLFGLLLFWR